MARPLLSTLRDGKARDRNRPGSIFYISTLALCFIFFVLVLLAFLLKTWWLQIQSHPKSPLPYTLAGGSSNTLGIPLHPQYHVSREPTTTFLRWEITAGFRRPDGVRKQVYLVNDMFPGPIIEARSGDELLIEVHNRLQDEGVSLHWHGLQLWNQNSVDGAIGITQCPISPGGNFTYRIKIGDSEHGTFWWHSHSHAQRSDGLFGGLVVHQPLIVRMADSETREQREPPTEDQEILLMIGDWFHSSWQNVMEWYTAFEHMGNEPVPDSMLINGKGSFNCSMAVPSRPVDCTAIEYSELGSVSNALPDRTRIRVINTGSIAGFSLQVGGALLTPIEVDGGNEVVGVSSEAIGVLYPGERVDLFVERVGPVRELLRLFISLDAENFQYTNPSLNPNQSFPMQQGYGYYENMLDFPDMNQSLDLKALKSRSGLKSVSPADQTFVIYVKTQLLVKYSNQPKGFINHTSWSPQTPPLISVNRTLWDENQLVPFIPSDVSNVGGAPWVDLIINNLDDGSHPFHLHGHAFYILSSYRSMDREGWGSYNPFDASDEPPSGLDLISPLRKDTVSVPRRGHVILRFQARNPGVWMLHCHMSVHLGSGLAMALHVASPEDAENDLGLQPSAAQLCL